MAQETEKRSIILPIAGEGEKRKTTTEIELAFKRILVVTSPQGTGGKGALIYIKGRKEPLQTAQTYTFKNWQEEIEQKDKKYGFPKYRQNFVSLGPRMMINMDLIDENYLDLSDNTLCLPPKDEGEKFPLDKSQIKFLTERYAERDNRWFHNSARINMSEMFLRRDMTENFEGISGFLLVLGILLIVNTGLLIAILCIVV